MLKVSLVCRKGPAHEFTLRMLNGHKEEVLLGLQLCSEFAYQPWRASVTCIHQEGITDEGR